jgi:hypothetical protein
MKQYGFEKRHICACFLCGGDNLPTKKRGRRQGKKQIKQELKYIEQEADEQE